MDLFKKLKDKIGKDVNLSELLQGASISFIFRIVGLLIGYIFTFILARGYGAEALGIYTLSLTILGIATLIGKLGTDTAFLKFVAELTAQNKTADIQRLYKKIMRVIIPFSVLVSILTYFLSPIIAESFFHKKYLTDYFQIVSLAVVPFILLAINREAIRGLKNIKVYSFLTNIAVVLISTLLLAILYFCCHGNNNIPLITQVIAITMVSILSFIFWFKYQNKVKKSTSAQEGMKYKDLFSVSIPMLITASMASIMGITDILMLGLFSMETDIGVYSVALKISAITSITLVAINTIAAPKFAEFWGQNDLEALSKIVKQSTKIIFWTSFPLLLILLVFSVSIMGLFGSEFKMGAVALIALTIGQFINSITGSVGYIMNMTNKQTALKYIIILSSIINMVLNYILIQEYGITGAAIATAIAISVLNILCAIYVYRTLKINTFYLPF